jgi:hypothetical protein
MDSLIIFLLDKSGSMAPSAYPDVGPATVAGYNKFLQIQQRRMDDCAYLFAQFESTVTYLSEFESIFKAPMLNFGYPRFDADPKSSYWPTGGTALWYTIAHTIGKAEAHIKSLPANERPLNVTFIVMTDGDDNSATDAAIAKIQAHPDWRFIYLGRTGPSALSKERHATQRQTMGVPAEWMLTYHQNTAEETFELMAATILDELVSGDSDGFKGV